MALLSLSTTTGDEQDSGLIIPIPLPGAMDNRNYKFSD